MEKAGAVLFLLPLLCSVPAAFGNAGETVDVRLRVDAVDGENAWAGQVLLAYEEAAFAFSRIPQAYTEIGTRDDWPNPLRVTASAEITLPKGRFKLLLRSRRAARFWVDGELLAENPFPPKISEGHDPVKRDYLDLGPEVRYLGPGDQETVVAFESNGEPRRMRLEFYVGGYTGNEVLRPETGETLVAYSREGESSFRILSPARSIPLTDAGWEAFEEAQQGRLDAFDRKRRKALRVSRDDYWERRHEWAKELLANQSSNREVGSIDQVIDARIERENEELDDSPEARHFIENVRPVLKDRCWSCHGGSKAKGDLRLDSREAAMKGGESEFPALAPGDLEESYLLYLVAEAFEEDRMPAKGDPLSDEQIADLKEWILDGGIWPETTLTKPIGKAELAEDWQFARRVYLDTVGVLPSESELRTFLQDESPNKRSRLIDRLLKDPRWADHWVSYWQDVLAENPTIVNPTLNNTGPFRWWIYDALRDNLPADRFASELIRMEGSTLGGGSAGFEMASQNDVPMAAKANILSTAFMATEMKCSRCHDAPFHSNTQEDLFSVAAMLKGEPIEVPESSSVPLDKLHEGNRKPLIEVTLPPGSEVSPKWPFEAELGEAELAPWLSDPNDTRERLALHLTGPFNERFPKVVVNRLWQRFFGAGIVEPVDDWEKPETLFPELLDLMAEELIRSDYDLKAVAREILNSKAYQRRTMKDPVSNRYFASQRPRRMSAEQIVDSLFVSVDKEMDTEPLTVDIGGGRPWSNAMSLGEPERAWMFGGMANNRDRPSLILPRAQAVVDVLSAFGWRASRQEPVSERSAPLSPLQPAILNNGVMAGWLTRLSEDHGLTVAAIEAGSPRSLIETVYLRLLNRFPTEEERRLGLDFLEPGFSQRLVDSAATSAEPKKEPPIYVTWANHLHPDANEVALKAAEAAKKGDPPSPRLQADWRRRMEDFVWSLINLPEFVYYP